MKTTFTYDTYLDYEALTQCLHTLNHQNPIMSMESLTKTVEGKDQWAITLSDNTITASKHKPAVYIDANIHAGEVCGSMTALYIIDVLCTNAQSNPQIADILRNYTFYIIPMVSPDGVDAYLNQHQKLRSVNRNYPHSVQQDGLHPMDIDGDGAIRMMRLKSQYGAWKVSSQDKRVLTHRLPTDTEGPFFHVFQEGYIHNYDGHTISTAPSNWGLDFNRNFPYGWFSESRQPGAGDYPLSNHETKALADFILSHKNIGFVNTLHTTGGVYLYPPGTTSEKQADQEDMKLFQKLRPLIKKQTGAETKNVFDAFLTDTINYSSGAFDDWCYETLGIPAFTIELWDCLNRAGIPYDKHRASDSMQQEANYLKVLNWIDDNLETNAFKPWTTFKHAQLGDIEIGGFNPHFIIQNPPPKFLYQEVQKHGQYLIESATLLPKLTLESFNLQKLAATVYQLDITIGNTGFMSTDLTKKACIQKTNTPVTITINKETIAQPNTQTLGKLDGFGTINTDYKSDGIHTQSTSNQLKTARFIFQDNTKTPLSITIKHPIAGLITKTINLP